MADPARARRLADRIRVIVAQTLDQRVKDPRLGFLTVTDARTIPRLFQPRARRTANVRAAALRLVAVLEMYVRHGARVARGKRRVRVD